jgi:hypothetical protein
MKNIEEVIQKLITGELYKIKILTRESEDYTLSWDGGDYSFWRNIVRRNGKFEVQYCTSSEITFCPYCGSFSHCNDSGEGCGCSPEELSIEEVRGLLQNNDFRTITCKSYSYIFINLSKVATI